MPMTLLDYANWAADAGYTKEAFAQLLRDTAGVEYYAADPTQVIDMDVADLEGAGGQQLEGGYAAVREPLVEGARRLMESPPPPPPPPAPRAPKFSEIARDLGRPDLLPRGTVMGELRPEPAPAPQPSRMGAPDVRAISPAKVAALAGSGRTPLSSAEREEDVTFSEWGRVPEQMVLPRDRPGARRDIDLVDWALNLPGESVEEERSAVVETMMGKPDTDLIGWALDLPGIGRAKGPKRLASKPVYDPATGQFKDVPEVRDVPKAPPEGFMRAITGMPSDEFSAREPRPEPLTGVLTREGHAKLDRSRDEYKRDVRADEFYMQAERPDPKKAPIQTQIAQLAPLHGVLNAFQKEVLENPTIQTWGAAMRERLLGVGEVAVQKAVEGDLRLRRLLFPERWNSDDDMDAGFLSAPRYYINLPGHKKPGARWDEARALPRGHVSEGIRRPGTGGALDLEEAAEGVPGDKIWLTRADRLALERLWDKQDREVVEAWDSALADTEAQADLLPWHTNARRSVGHLANGLFEMGASLVGGNIPIEAWKAESPEARAEALRTQAVEVLDDMFGKDMSAFAYSVLANPIDALEVHAAPIAFMFYGPMKKLGTPAARLAAKGTGKIADELGALGPNMAYAMTKVKRGAAFVESLLGDPAFEALPGATTMATEVGRRAVKAQAGGQAALEMAAIPLSKDVAAGPGKLVALEEAAILPQITPPKMPVKAAAEGPWTAYDPAGYPSLAAAEAHARSPAGMGRYLPEAEVLPVGAPGRTSLPKVVEGEVIASALPEERLGYRFAEKAVDVDATTGISGAIHETSMTGLKPIETAIGKDVGTIVRQVAEIWGPKGVQAIGKGLITESETGQAIVALIDQRLANQLISPTAQKRGAAQIVTEVNTELWGGKMPAKLRKKLTKEVYRVLEDAAGRRRGAGGTSEVWSPTFNFTGPRGKTLKLRALDVLAKMRLNDPKFRAQVTFEGMVGVARRLSEKMDARAVQSGLARQIVESNPGSWGWGEGGVAMDAKAFARADAPTQAAMVKEAMRGGKAVEKATELRRAAAREREGRVEALREGKRGAEVDAFTKRADALAKEAAEVELLAADQTLFYYMKRYQEDGWLPTVVQVSPESLLNAYKRMELRDPMVGKRFSMLREHLNPERGMVKILGEDADPLMSAYLGAEAAGKGAQQAYRRVVADNPLKGLSKLGTDVWGYRPMMKGIELMARDRGKMSVAEYMGWYEEAIRLVKMGKVAGNPGAHLMAFGSNALVAIAQRGDPFIVAKASKWMVDYLRYRAGQKTDTPRWMYEALERSGRLHSSFIRGELDRRIRREIGSGRVGGGDWKGDLMTLGGRRIYDMWDIMFKGEHGLDQLTRRYKDWGKVKEGEYYDLPISMTKTVRAHKGAPKEGMGDMIVDGRRLTTAQEQQLMGRAAMEPGSHMFGDFSDTPRIAQFKNQVPFIDLSLRDFASWDMITNTLPGFREGLPGKIWKGATTEGATNSRAVLMGRAAEQATMGVARALSTGALIDGLDENHEALRKIHNRYKMPHFVFSISATGDNRLSDVMDGSTFSVWGSTERWLRAAESLTPAEWIGMMRPDDFVKFNENEQKMLLKITKADLQKMTPAQRQHAVRSLAFWKEQATGGGLSPRGWLSLMWLEGNMMANWMADMHHESPSERKMTFKELASQAMLRSFMPKWAQALAETAAIAYAQSDVEEYQQRSIEGAKEETRLKEALRAGEIDQATFDKKIKGLRPTTLKAQLDTIKALSWAASTRKVTGTEYAAEGTFSDVPEELRVSWFKHFAQRALKGKKIMALLDRYTEVEGKREKVKRGPGYMRRRRTLIQGAITEGVDEFLEGFNNSRAQYREAVYAGDVPRMKGELAVHRDVGAVQQFFGGIKDDPNTKGIDESALSLREYLTMLIEQEFVKAEQNWNRRLGPAAPTQVKAEPVLEERQPLERWPRPVWNQPPE